MLGDRHWEAFRRHRAGRVLWQMIDTLDQHHAPIAASAIAFDAFLSLIPLSAAAGMVMHRLNESGEVLIGPLLRVAPRPVAQLVDDAVQRLLDGNAAVIAPLSVAAFLWTTSSGLSTAMSVFEQMFHSPERPWYWRRGIAIVCIIASVAMVAAVTSITVGIGMLFPRVGALIAVVLPTLTLAGLLSAFFRISVRRGPVFTRRRVLPGVAVTIVLWALLSGLFSFYVSTLSRYATLYGGLAAVAIFMFWLWLLAFALLVGGEVNAQLDGIRDAAQPNSATIDARSVSGAERTPVVAAADGATAFSDRPG
jgi:membrane protein